jgi:hypothetical protein
VADNTVEVTIRARDLSGAAYASAEAKEKAFQRLVDQGNKQFQKLGDQNAALVERSARARQDAAFLIGRADHFMAQEAEKAAKIQEDLDSRLGGGGFLSRIAGGFASIITQLGTLAGMGTAVINPITVALAGLAAVLAGPLIAALLPITVGFGTLAAVVIPEVDKVIKALQAKGPAAQKAWAALSPDERAIGRQIKDLGRQFSDLAKAVQPEVLTAFHTALRIVKDLMPVLTPLAVAAGKALDGFLKNIENWLKSDSGKKFIKWMETDGPKAIETFGRVMWDVAQGIGRTFWFLRMAGDRWFTNVHNGLKTIHQAWSETINWFVERGHFLEHSWDNLTSFAARVWHTLVNIWHTGVSQIEGIIRGAIGVIRSVWAAVYGALVKPIESAWNTISGIVSKITGALSSINSALGGIPGKLLSTLGFASGGIVGAAAGGGPRGGLTWVGERGPELVRLPLGSQVYPSGQSMAMAAHGVRGGGDTFNIHVQVSPGTAPAEVGRQLAYHLGEFKKRGGMIYRPAGF